MNFKEKTYIFLLIAIIFLAFFLRFYKLGQNPPSLTWDETAWGYNAYSIGIDGKDEYGRFLPLDYLESFGDFKPPLYAYLAVLPVKLLGLNEFATRFPSALFGVLTVFVTYFLAKRIFFSSNNKIALALSSSFFLAISPWHINLSRAAFEANVATFFIVCGVWLFLASIQNKKWFLLLSVTSFILSIYTFNTARVVSPILLILLTIVFLKRIWHIKSQLIIAIVLGLLLIFPIFRFLLSPQASLRFKEVNIFSDIGIINLTNQEILNDNGSRFSKIIHNRRFAYTAEYLRHYFDHFKPNFLFITGDGNPKFSTQDVGQMYLWELPFFVFGFLYLFKARNGYWWIIPIWLLVGIIPAATARETPHALRIEAALPTFQIIVAIGVFTFIERLRKSQRKMLKTGLFGVVLILFLINFAYYLHGYYNHYAREYSGEWQYGYKDSIKFAEEVSNNYDEIQMTTELGRPHMYYLYYLKIDPKIYRKIAVVKRDAFGFVTVERFGKYYFAKNLKKNGLENKRVLYINNPINTPQDANIVKTFYLLNGKPVLFAYRLGN